MGTIALIVFGLGMVWVWRKNIQWFESDIPDYEKSPLEKSIQREVNLSRFEQYQGRYPPPTYPDDL